MDVVTFAFNTSTYFQYNGKLNLKFSWIITSEQHTATDLDSFLYFLRPVSFDHTDFVKKFEKMDKKKKLILHLVYRIQIAFQLGCEQRKSVTENYVQDMMKILRIVKCFILGFTR